jgi:hypothetical protein
MPEKVMTDVDSSSQLPEPSIPTLGAEAKKGSRLSCWKRSPMMAGMLTDGVAIGAAVALAATAPGHFGWQLGPTAA